MKVCRTIEPGVYRHFKGGEYEVVGLARHSETEEELVVYRALYGDGGLWVRPSEMFLLSLIHISEPTKSQDALTKRRIEALRIARRLIEREMG